MGARALLLVEDEPRLRAFTTYQLTSLDLETIAVGSAAEARRLARERRFDLLIADLGMPERGGATLARELRRAQPDLAILLLSTPEERAAAPSLERCQRLEKPFRLPELDAALRAVLEPRERR